MLFNLVMQVLSSSVVGLSILYLSSYADELVQSSVSQSNHKCPFPMLISEIVDKRGIRHLAVLLRNVSALLSMLPALALSQWVRSFTAMILSRFILDLRLLLFEESDEFEPTTSELVFPVPIKTANVIGNLGATVRSHSAGRHGMRQGWDEDDEVPEFSRDPFKLGLKASLAVSEAQ